MKSLVEFIKESKLSPKEEMITKLNENPYRISDFGTTNDKALTKYLKDLGATDLEVYNSTIDSTPRYDYDKNGSILEWIEKNAGDKLKSILAFNKEEKTSRPELNDNRIGTHDVEITTNYKYSFYTIEDKYLLCCYNTSRSTSDGKGKPSENIKLEIYKLKAKYTK